MINIVFKQITEEKEERIGEKGCWGRRCYLQKLRKGDGEVTELWRRPEMGCDGTAAEIGDGLWLDRDRRWIGEERKFWSDFGGGDFFCLIWILEWNESVTVLCSVLVFSKTVWLIIDPPSMDRFRTVIHQFSLISVRFSSTVWFSFWFFCSPLDVGHWYVLDTGQPSIRSVCAT